MIEIKEIRDKFPQYSEISDGELILAIHKKFYGATHVKDFVGSIDGADIAVAKMPKGEMRDYWRTNVVKPREGESDNQAALRSGGSAEGAVGDSGGKLGTIARSGLQGLTYGFGDEIVAGGATAAKNLFGGGTTYDQELQAERDRLEIGRAQNPKSALAAEIGGALALPGTALKMGPKMMPNVLKSAAVAGTGGTVYGFGAGEDGFQSRAKDGLVTGGFSALAGAAAPVVGSKIKKMYDKASLKKAIKLAGKTAPSMDELKASAQKIYAAADDAAPLSRAKFAETVQGSLDKATRKGLDADLTPGASTAFSRSIDAATDPSKGIGFSELDTLRRKAQIPAGNFANKTESAIGSGLINSIDDFVDAASPELGKEIGAARKMWSQLSKSKAVAKIMKNAELQPSGFDNGLKIGFRSLLKNEKALRGFSEMEVDVMRQIVEGTRAGNIMSKVGKLGVGLGSQSNMLLSSLAAGGGAAVAGVPGAILAPVIGTLAQKGAERSTVGSAKALQGLIASGGSVTAPKLAQSTQGLLEGAIRRGARSIAPSLQ